MPVVLRRGYAGNFSDELLGRHVLCSNIAVQCMTPAQIHALLMGDPDAEDVSLLCCMVTDLASEDGSPLWCAAVTATYQICSSDEMLVVPLSAQWVRGALLRAISSYKTLEFPENNMLRRLISAHRSARNAEPVCSIAMLEPECNTPWPNVACVRTLHALLAVHAPPELCPRPSASARAPGSSPCLEHTWVQAAAAAAAAGRRIDQWVWDELPLDLQTTIVHCCVTNGGDSRSLRAVCRAFRAVVDEEVGAVRNMLISAVRNVDARRAHSVGMAAAKMGLRPVHMFALDHAGMRGCVRACVS